jgi:hypothetical protein
MPSRRRRRSKNLGTNLAEVQRRLRYLERRPVRTKLQRNVVTTAAIAVNAVTPDEVSFGTTVITDAPTSSIENPKDGLLVINETAGTTSVYSESQDTYIQLPAVDDDARSVANGKNTIYYQNSAPSGGTYAVDDTWFDVDDGYKMYTWTGTTWSGFQLGNSAIASIAANKITAGSLAAGVIVTSNLSAGQITTGNLDAARIATTALNANNITAGTISGITIQTSSSGNRIAMTNTDELQFFNTAGTRIGTIGPTDYGPTNQEGLVLTSGVSGAADTARLGLQSDAFSSYAHLSANDFLSPSVILTYAGNGTTQRVNINGGGSSALDGSVDILAGQGGITIRSYTGDLAAADEISFYNDYAGSGSIGILSDRIRLYGTLVVAAQTVEQGTGAPSNYTGSEATANIGAIFFKYT